MLLPSSSWSLLAICLLLTAFSLKVLATVDEEKTGKDGKNWFTNKWYASDTVYIDSDGNPQKSVAYSDEGSGDRRGRGRHSDTVTGSGYGPDDEDADSMPEHGSGDISLQEIKTTVAPTVRPHVVWQEPLQTTTSTTTERPWWIQQTDQTSTTTASTVHIVEIGVNKGDKEDEEDEDEGDDDDDDDDAMMSTTSSTSTTLAAPTTEIFASTTSATDTSIYDVDQKRNALDPFLRPGILAAVIGGAVVGLLAAILLVMFIVYRMRKKDEGSYALEEPKAPPTYPYAYQKAPTKEFYA